MVTRQVLAARQQDQRLDVLAAWRAVDAGDYAAPRHDRCAPHRRRTRGARRGTDHLDRDDA